MPKITKGHRQPYTPPVGGRDGGAALSGSLPERPPNKALLATWRTFAEACGYDTAGKTKKDLIGLAG